LYQKTLYATVNLFEYVIATCLGRTEVNYRERSILKLFGVQCIMLLDEEFEEHRI